MDLIMLLISILNAGRTLLFFMAFKFTSVGNAVIISNTAPIFTFILSAFFLKEKITLKKTLLFLLAFIGVIIVYANKKFSFDSADFIGMTLVLISSIGYGFTVILFKKESHRKSRFEILFWQNIAGVFIFLPFIFINRPVPTASQAGLAIIFALTVGVVGFGLFFSALKKLPAATMALMGYLEIPSAILLAFLLLKEAITTNTIVGGILIVTSSALLQLTEKKSAVVPAP